MKEYIMQETEEQTTFGSVWKKYEPVQELVRCKDCIYFGNADKCIVQKYLHEHPEKIWFLSQQEDWFCADGKRKQS